MHEGTAVKTCSWKAPHLPSNLTLLNLMLFIQITGLFFVCSDPLPDIQRESEQKSHTGGVPFEGQGDLRIFILTFT